VSDERDDSVQPPGSAETGQPGPDAEPDEPGPDAEPGQAGPSRRRRLVDILIIMLVPLVLSGVALHQVYLATASDLTPWKGGGFGMFSSPDRSGYRAVRGSFEGELGEVPIDMYSLMRRAEGDDLKTFINARALPDARRMDPLADVVGAAEWRIRDDGVAIFAGWRDDRAAGGEGVIVWVGTGEGREAVHVDRFTIEVWGPRYSIDDKVIEPRLIAAHHYAAGADPAREVRR
jgi:hypothetical protein